MTDTIRDDLAILILGTAAALNNDAQRVIALLDAQVRALLDALPRIPRLPLARRRDLACLAQRIARARLEGLSLIVTVDTLRRWYRELVARKWTHPRLGAGRPPIPAETTR